ncbi:MAG: hypothetical protein BJG00_002430 [Limnothrix sp. CACIAM 69d]|nr:MAG: hypothetical protein BJG00_002430 [Limnothrix sp. CACIAM 69d]
MIIFGFFLGFFWVMCFLDHDLGDFFNTGLRLIGLKSSTMAQNTYCAHRPIGAWLFCSDRPFGSR